MRCKGCGGDIDADDICWRCPPVSIRKSRERSREAGDTVAERTVRAVPPVTRAPDICTPEQNAAGLAALRAAIYAKPGPMAAIVARVCRRMNGEDDEIPF